MKRVFGGAIIVILLIAGGAVIYVATLRSAARPHALSVNGNVSLSVTDTKVGTTLTDTSYGLSLEAAELTHTQFGHGNFAARLSALGKGVLRIGANRVDDTFWTSTKERAPSWSTGTITPQAIDRLAAVARTSGWKVILGVNLKHFDPQRSAEEAKYAQRSLGGSLMAIEIGNEPGIYYSDFTRFAGDYSVYINAIKAAAPGVAFVGAEAQHSSPSEAIAIPFAKSQNLTRDIVDLTEHHYSQTSCANSSTTIAKLLSVNTYSADKSFFDTFVQRAKGAKVPALLDETNSVSCGGQAGVSDVFASALWTMTYGLEAAHEGISGTYFHGDLAQCDTAKPDYMYYTPLCARSSTAAKHGNVNPQPQYYAMMAMQRIESGSFLSISNSAYPTVHAFAIEGAKRLKVVVINERNSAAYTATSFAIHVPVGFTHALQSTLSSASAYPLKDKNHVSLSKRPTVLAINGNNVSAVVPNGGAAIITFS